jgi:hypothetical protein
MSTAQYRAWHKTEKKMYAVAGLQWTSMPDSMTTVYCGWPQMVTLFSFDGTSISQMAHVALGEIVLMQYTGLRDKNGTLIFEGDVCKRDGWGQSQPVRFHDGHFLFGDNFTIGQVFTSDCEVVGDIYSTPHLLTHEKEPSACTV